MPARIAIEVVSDMVCPWCFIGKRQLERALSRMPDVAAVVSWKPFFLDPGVPREGLDAQAYLSAKFGSPEVLERMHTRLSGVAAEAGIQLQLAAQKKRPNTIDAHRLVHWASEVGVQSAVVEALFRGYFEKGRDIGDPHVLTAIADNAGMDADEVREKLTSDDDIELIKAEARAAREREISGVPAMSFEGFLLPGAQSPDVYEQVIRRVLTKRSS